MPSNKELEAEVTKLNGELTSLKEQFDKALKENANLNAQLAEALKTREGLADLETLRVQLDNKEHEIQGLKEQLEKKVTHAAQSLNINPMEFSNLVAACAPMLRDRFGNFEVKSQENFADLAKIIPQAVRLAQELVRQVAIAGPPEIG